jgi:hypothetical protein
MAGNRLLCEPKVSERPEAVGPARGPRDLCAEAEGVLREVAYVLHLTRRVTAAMSRPDAARGKEGGPGA